MDFLYKTDRLNIKILQADSTAKVLDFYLRNRRVFEPYEPKKPPNYYTMDYQQKLISSEYHSFLNLKYIRFFIMEKNNPTLVIGTISFGNIQFFPYFSCVSGYKFDLDHQKQGYASEAMQKCISIIFNELKLHRIEAYIMPSNMTSIRFICRHGFRYEGVCYKQIEINGKWEDHLRYSLIHDK